MEDDNARIQGELKYWNDLYSEETGTTPPPNVGAIPSSPTVSSNAPPAVPASVSSLIMGFENVASGSGEVPSGISTPLSPPILSSPLSGIGNVGRFDPAGNFTPSTPANVNPSGGFGTWEPSSFTRQQSSRRESFGSVFPGSSGTGGMVMVMEI